MAESRRFHTIGILHFARNKYSYSVYQLNQYKAFKHIAISDCGLSLPSRIYWILLITVLIWPNLQGNFLADLCENIKAGWPQKYIYFRKYKQIYILLGFLNTLCLLGHRLGRIRSIMFHWLGSFHARPFQATTVHEDTGNLGNTDAAQEEVDSSETWSWPLAHLALLRRSPGIGILQHVPGSDDHTPPGPDGTGSHESSVLCERKLFSRTTEVRDTSNNKTPLPAEINSQLVWSSPGPIVTVSLLVVIRPIHVASHPIFIYASERTFITGAL